MASQILVPLDGSKNSFRGLSKAIMLAKLTNSEITALFVIQNSPSELDVIKNLLKKKQKMQYINIMKKASLQCKNNNISFFDVLEYGNVGDVIVSFAKKNRFDFIVIGSRGMGSIKETFLGSTSSSVIHNSKIPVLVVK